MPTQDPERTDVEETESSGDLRQALLREVNEEIERLNSEWELGGSDTVLCECGHADCMEQLDISPVDYERVRRFPTRFVVKPNHVGGEDERVVEEKRSYVVVEKIGPGAATAIQHDPRRSSGREQAA